MNKKVIIGILVVLMIILGGSAIYIAVRLNEEASVIPEESKAVSWPNSCNGGCGSGKQCNSNGKSGWVDPAPGKMWSCIVTYPGGVRTSTCEQTPTDEIFCHDPNDPSTCDPGCFMDDSCTWQPECGCNEGECITACRAQLSGPGSATYTMACSICEQDFTCECSITPTPTGSPTNTPTGSPTNTPTGSPTNTPTGSPTNTPTGSPTNTPTNTPTGTPTKTPTNTPTGSPTITLTQPITTIPQTALITDEVDRILIGVGMIFIGIMVYMSVSAKPKVKTNKRFEDKIQDRYDS
jgi:hypothetical protein